MRQERARKVDPPPQKQRRQPGRESEMTPKSRAVAVAFAREGADVAILYLAVSATM